ncbi:MAG: hypothetical protein ABIF18_03450 [archaeon]
MGREEDRMKELNRFLFFMKFVWPVYRKFVGGMLSKRCNSCFLSENYVKLNKDGICGECLNFKKGNDILVSEKKRGLMKKEFDKILKSYVGKGGWKYDALVMFSGGKDSCYMLDKLKKEYPQLKILAFSFDNSFMSPIAVENIKSSIGKLSVDHMFFRADESMMIKMFQYAFLHLNKKGCSGTVDEFDGALLHDVAVNVAYQMKIPLVLSGVSEEQIERILKLDYFEDKKGLENIMTSVVAGINLKKIFSNDELKLWWDGNGKIKEDIPRRLFPYYAWGYNEDEVLNKVVDLGLLDKNKTNPILTNSSLIPFMGIVDMCKLGYSSFEPEFARNVRLGRSDRKKWLYTFEMLEYAAKSGRFINKSVEDMLVKLGLTKEDVGII